MTLSSLISSDLKVKQGLPWLGLGWVSPVATQGQAMAIRPYLSAALQILWDHGNLATW